MSVEASAAAGTEEVFDVTLPADPYPGLRPFVLREWPIFFGRERMADEVIAQLVAKRVLVVHGDSGCGKSSLVRAAVLSRLEQENARCGVRWRTCAAVPREAPLWNLAEAIAGLVADRDEERTIAVRRALNCGPGAPDALDELLPSTAGDRFCVLLDQFEEVFAHARRHGDDEARLLTELLVALHARTESRLYVVLTMRSEFLGACARFAGLAELVNATQYLLPRMDTADLRRAICDPAGLFDGRVTFELADRLIADAGGGQDQLPLIQHGVMLLHRAHVRGGGPWKLGLEHFPQTGGLAGLLSDHADDVMQRTGTPEVVEAVFRELTEINAEGQAIRRPRTLAQLIMVTGLAESAVRKVVDAFRTPGVSFLQPYGDDPLEPTDLVDVSHEALIRCWRKLADKKDGWLLKEFRHGLIWQALLVQADSFESDPTNVLGPVATDDRERWFKEHTKPWTERYGGGFERVAALISASVVARDQERADQAKKRRLEAKAKVRKFWVRVLSGIVVLALTTSVFAFLQWRKAEKELGDKNEYISLLWDVRQQKEALQDQLRRTEALQSQTQQSATTLKDAALELTKAAQTDRDLPIHLQSVITKITDQANKLPDAAAPPPTDAIPPPPPPAAVSPRVYVQIADEAQRATARTFEIALEKAAAGQPSVVVPGIELVKTPTSRNVLRCFRAEDCAGDGPALVARMNAILATPEIALEDQSARYGTSSSIRPRHFELWFAPGAITLK